MRILVAAFTLGLGGALNAPPAAAQLVITQPEAAQSEQPLPAPERPAPLRSTPSEVEQAPPAATSEPAAKIQDRAETSVDRSPPARFRFERVGSAFLRLDSVSGEVAYCSSHPGGWTCDTLSEGRPGSEAEIARLNDEVRALKQEIATLRASPPTLPPPVSSVDKRRDYSFKPPTREDLDHVRAYLERTWRLVADMIVNLERYLISRGEEAVRSR
ncbi:MAG: hypothetical protein IRY89_06375 [Pseudolabrys sp.]|nr:hypothetical protein [Pseudolabrys sp.]